MKVYEEYKDSGIFAVNKIPSHWDILRNKYIFIKNKSIVGNKWDEYNLLSLTTKGVSLKDIHNPVGKLPESFSGYQKVEKNDIILCLFDLDVSAVFSGLSNYNGMISPAYNVYKVSDIANPGYFNYWFKMMNYNRKYIYYSKNIRYTVSNEVFNDIPSVIPPIEEQKQIASYLDYKISKMDELILKKEELVETLKNARQKLISETVTKGLDKDVKMKYSGIEWIGEIPEHWEIKELKYLLSENITDGPHETPEFLDEGISFLSVDGIINGELNFKNCRKISLESHNRYSKKCKPEYNNILFGKSASVGKVARVKTTQEFSVWSPLALIKLDESNVEPGFIEYFLKSDTIKKNIMFYSTFNTQQNISMDKIKRFKIIVPPLKEQLEVLNFLELRCLKIDELISKTEEQIEILKKAKQSLIAEVVTGKIDVRGWTE